MDILRTIAHSVHLITWKDGTIDEKRFLQKIDKKPKNKYENESRFIVTILRMHFA